MEQSSPSTTSTSTPTLARMHKWTNTTLESIDLHRPFLVYSESDISYTRNEAYIKAAYHVGVRLNKQVGIIGGQFHYFHNVHRWIYIDELVYDELTTVGAENETA